MSTPNTPTISAQTHQTILTIDLQGHMAAYGASFDCEVEFTRTPVIPMRWPSLNSAGEPAEGGEVEIVEIRPFRDGTGAARKEYLDAPPWLLDRIRECIDTDLLTGE